MTRPSGYRSRRGEREGGFALIEVIVALFLLSMVASAVLALFFRGMQATSHLQRNQSADAVASEAMEKVRSISAVVVPGGTSGILMGRAQADVAAVWVVAATVDIAGSTAAYDPAAPTGATPAVPLVTDTVRSGIHYTVTTLIGECYRQATGSGEDRSCVATNPGTYVRVYRVIVVVTWKPTSWGQCSGAAVCTYRMSSLVDPNPESNWNLTAKPVAYDDEISAVTGDPPTSYEIMANDVIGSVRSNPVTMLSDPALGAAAVVTSGTAMGMLNYTPPPAASGRTSLTYMLRDAAGRTSGPGTVNISVLPKADADFGTVALGESVVIDLTDNIHGTLGASPVTLVGGPPGAVVAGTFLAYAAPMSGTSATFSYTVTDTSGLVSAPATVTVTVVSAASPTAADLAIPIAARGAAAATDLNLLALTHNYAGSTIVVVSGPTAATGWSSPGALTGSRSSAVTYSPTVNTVGVYTFTYYVKHPTGAVSTTQTVTLTVWPVATNDVVTGARSSAGTVNVGLNDVPTTGMTFAAGTPSGAVCNTVSMNSSTGVVSFTMKTVAGTCTVPYTLSKTGSTTLSGTATLTVNVP